MVTTTKNVAEKLATKSHQTNGNDLKISIPKSSVNLPVIVPGKKEETVKIALLPIEQRLKKLAKLQQLAERREILIDAIENLQGFYISPDGNGCNLRLQDSKAKTFAIAHPIIIGEMVSMAKSKLSAELEKIESQIDFSTI